MADHLDPARRSANMAAVRSKDTKPEMAVRSLVHKLGYRYRLHVAGLPGKPDLVFAGRGKVIFVHGCFWHRHKGCRYTTTPASNAAFWEREFCANTVRDRQVQRDLKILGWKTLIIWQCELRNPTKLARRLREFLTPAD